MKTSELRNRIERYKGEKQALTRQRDDAIKEITAWG
jgi:hypothetical protein